MDLPLGQLFLIGFDGKTVPDEARRLLTEEKAGGAILFSRNLESLEQLVELNAELSSLGTAEHPVLVSIDQEGGRVQRLRDIATRIPPMRALGASCPDDNDLPYRVGAMMARELSALGFHLDFAPVLDVDTNPQNPVIGERSFGRDPRLVATCGAQLIRGMQQAGVAACGKHFPGHGDTDVDSHLALPRVPHDLRRLKEVELVPFRLAVEVGVASIMTAHVMLPALDPELPATLSAPILTGLLREGLGYDGVIVTDDLEMAAVGAQWSVEKMVELGLRAGVDLFLICHSPDKQARAIEAARSLVASGKVPKERVEQALARVRRLKKRFVGAPAAPSLDEARRIVRSPPHERLMARFAEGTEGERPRSRVDDA